MSTEETLFPMEGSGRKQAKGPQAECIRIWEGGWLKSRGYAWKWTSKHAANVARALKMAGSVAEFEIRAANLLAAQEPFLKKAASPGILVMHWNDPVVAKRPPRTMASRPSSPPPTEKPAAILPAGWGARMAEALRSRAGVETVLRELQPGT